LYKTEQERFWAGEFGDDYVKRCQSKAIIAADLALFSSILRSTRSVSSVLEFGANIGLNLTSINSLLPNAEMSGIEINKEAVSVLKKNEGFTVHHTSILDFTPEKKNDFVFIKGVLIHINPDELQRVYESLYDSSSRYICVAEYYNPVPVAVNYRGHEGKLFKRDFAGEIMDKYSDLKLVDYGFVYSRDNNFVHDDLTWFLMEKEK
jgi:spore coat polysaccharide biosynthesis protein SpsF